MAAGDNYFPGDSHLLGDGAYAIHPHLMVPFRDNGHLTLRQINFNMRLSQARQTIERAFGLLKGRFRSLRDKLSIHTISKIPEYIVACCVLHNVCVLQLDEMVEMVEPAAPAIPPPVDAGDAAMRDAGVLKRVRIMEQM
jgi:hypothetical protein